MNFGIIGAGRVGCSLAIALKSVNQNISGIYSRSRESQSELSRMLGGIYPNDLKATINSSEVIFICVPDDYIEEVCEEIADIMGPNGLQNKVIYHTSGAKSSEELESCQEMGGSIGSLHMLMTFPDKYESWKNVFKALMSVEGDEEAVNVAIKIASILEVNLWEIKTKEDKVLYHAAACVLSNYTVTIMQITCELFKMMGLDEKEGLESYRPLLEASIKNAVEMGPIHALTGPIRRADLTTIKQHLEELSYGPEFIKMFYSDMGLTTAKLAYAYGLISDEQFENVEELIFNEEDEDYE